jgi:hypothetical protein
MKKKEYKRQIQTIMNMPEDRFAGNFLTKKVKGYLAQKNEDRRLYNQEYKSAYAEEKVKRIKQKARQDAKSEVLGPKKRPSGFGNYSYDRGMLSMSPVFGLQKPKKRRGTLE